MADEEYCLTEYPHENIEAAYNALLALEDLDVAMYGGKRMEARLKRNALKIIDKALQEIADSYEETEEED
jgi:hypothetical protein